MLDWIAPEVSRDLTTSERQHNATLIYNYFSSWSYGAKIALIANMQAESGVNPNRWQDDKINYRTGYGLVQWTPATKYFDWAGYDNKNYDFELFRIDWEVENNEQWGANPKLPPAYPENPPFNFRGFTQSELSYRDLTALFLMYYEKPGGISEKIPVRHKIADTWNEFFKGQPPIPPHAGGRPLNFIYYLKPYKNFLMR